jgi:hypothetical protein
MPCQMIRVEQKMISFGGMIIKKTLAWSKSFAMMQLMLKLFWVMRQHDSVGMIWLLGYFSDPIIRLDTNTNDTRLLVWVFNRTNSLNQPIRETMVVTAQRKNSERKGAQSEWWIVKLRRRREINKIRTMVRMRSGSMCMAWGLTSLSNALPPHKAPPPPPHSTTHLILLIYLLLPSYFYNSSFT